MKKPQTFRPNISSEGVRKFNGHAHWDELYKTSDWIKYRLEFLKINSRCYSCGEVATVVDHLVPHQGDKILFEKLDNHIPLCSRCHNTITGKFDRNHRPGSTVTEKIKWVNVNRERNDLTFRVKVLPRFR